MAKNRNYSSLVNNQFCSRDPYVILAEELGPMVKEYRRKWKMAGEKLVDFGYPLHLNLELVYGCNLRCEFCILSQPLKQSSYKARPTDRIPFDKYCQIIDEGAKNNLYSIMLNGYNEPLLQKDIVKYINYARKAGIVDISMHTNGLLLTEALSKSLIDSGLTTVMFSIDANTALTYGKIRKGGDFDKLKNNIETFIRLKKASGKTLPLIKVSFVETKLNAAELKDFVNYWKEKVDFLTIQSFANPFVGLQKYSEIESEYRKRNISFTVCSEPYQRLTITCDGNVFPCCSFYALELNVGSIYKDTVYNIWNSTHMRELRKSINGPASKQPVGCRKCRDSFKTLKGSS